MSDFVGRVSRACDVVALSCSGLTSTLTIFVKDCGFPIDLFGLALWPTSTGLIGLRGSLRKAFTFSTVNNGVIHVRTTYGGTRDLLRCDAIGRARGTSFFDWPAAGLLFAAEEIVEDDRDVCELDMGFRFADDKNDLVMVGPDRKVEFRSIFAA